MKRGVMEEPILPDALVRGVEFLAPLMMTEEYAVLVVDSVDWPFLFRLFPWPDKLSCFLGKLTQRHECQSRCAKSRGSRRLHIPTR